MARFTLAMIHHNGSRLVGIALDALDGFLDFFHAVAAIMEHKQSDEQSAKIDWDSLLATHKRIVFVTAGSQILDK